MFEKGKWKLLELPLQKKKNSGSKQYGIPGGTVEIKDVWVRFPTTPPFNTPV